MIRGPDPTPRAPAPPSETPDRNVPGLYVHVPFCSRICPYCDFAVTPLGRSGGRRFDRFRKALLREIALRAAPLAADTVYFGGGTPSLAPPGLLSDIVEAAARAGLAAPEALVFVEANPEDLARDPGLAGRWVAEGVRGVSLGAQALEDGRLRFLGRAHSAADVGVAVSRLAEAGIPWVSMDLIYGTLGQRAVSLRKELTAAAALPGVRHVSAYELTIESGTPFGRRAAAGERLTAKPEHELFRVVHETLAECGFPAYEAANFAAAPEFRSRHNRKYWNGARYVGVGPSAHSFDPERSERSWNHRALAEWEAGVLERGEPTAGSERLGPVERALEEFFLRLRTTDGLDLGGFAERYGQRVVRSNLPRFRDWRARGLVRLEEDGAGGRLRPTLPGLAVADALAREVVLDALRHDRNAA